jgi:hypothetical protein
VVKLNLFTLAKSKAQYLNTNLIKINMKKWIILSFALITTSLAMAQTKVKSADKLSITPEVRAEKYTAKMQKAVGLDEAQVKQVYDLRLEKVKQIKEIRDANKDNAEKVKELAKPIAKEYNTSLKGILTSVQMEKWRAHRKTEKEKIKANQEKRAKSGKNTKAKESTLTDDDLMDSVEED